MKSSSELFSNLQDFAYFVPYFDPDPPFFPFAVLESVDYYDLDLEDVGSANGNGNGNGNGNALFYLPEVGLDTLPLLVLSLFAALAFLEDLNDLTDFDLNDLVGNFDPFAFFKPLILASFLAKHVAKRVRDAIMIEL